MMKKIMKGVYAGKSVLSTLSTSHMEQPFGEDFGMTILPNYLSLSDIRGLRKGYADVYTRKSASIVMSDGRFHLPPMGPSYFMEIIERLENDGLIPRDWINNQTLNLYEQGDFIRSHVDNLFTYDDIFVVASIGANALMKFVHIQNGEELEVIIPDRSIYIMSGPARYVYFHMVLPVEAQRVSAVFRRCILQSDGSFRTPTTPLGHLLPYKANALQNLLMQKQIGGIRVNVDDDFMLREQLGAFDTAKWVKGLKPLRDWTLLSQLDEDELRIKELKEKRFIDVDLDWRVKELREYYKGIQEGITDASTP